MAYVKPTLAEQIEQTVAILNVSLGTTEASLRFSILNAFATAISGATNGVYQFGSYIADQVFLDTADTEQLERYGAIFQVPRAPAESSTGATITFEGGVGAVVPYGMEMKRSDDVRFKTTQGGTIDSTGKIVLPVIAVKSGTSGNTPVGTSLTVTSPPISLSSSAIVGGVGIVGGGNEATNEEFREDIYDKIRTPPQGGSKSDYETWAYEVDNVTRAWVYTPETTPSSPVGEVFIIFTMDDKYVDGIPLEIDVEAVKDHIQEERPVTAKFTVFSPLTQDVDFDIRISPNTTEVKTAVTESLKNFFLNEATPGSIIRHSRLMEVVSGSSGEDYHYMLSPTGDIDPPDFTLPVLGTITWSS